MIKIRISKSSFKRIRHAFYFVGALTVFFFVSTYQNFESTQRDHLSSISKKHSVNSDVVSPEELFLDGWELIKNNYWDRSLNGQNWNYWKKRYHNKIKTQDDAYLALNTIIASLDDSYSKFLSENEYSEKNAIMQSRVYGVGINIASLSGKVYIFNVLKGTPADLGDLRAGDIILGVNGRDTKGKTIFVVSQYIKGSMGQYVEFELLRDGKKITKKIKREEIKIKTVEYKSFDDIGYIHILSFISQETPKEFIGALDSLKDKKGLIIDLRGNTGGLLHNAIFISNLFLEKGDIVNIVGQDGNYEHYGARSENFIYSKPLVILIDSNSLSSSEIFASAMQDNKRATLVGTKTYGKGLIQNIFPLPNKTALNLTIARYLTPSGKDINKVGVTPDYEVFFTKDDIEKNNDRQLNFALGILKPVQ